VIRGSTRLFEAGWWLVEVERPLRTGPGLLPGCEIIKKHVSMRVNPPVGPKAARDGGLHGLAKVGGCSRVSARDARAVTSCQDQGVAA
jgi:hypothetical protein